MMNPETYLIEEKYHPTELDKIILPKRIKSLLEGIVKSENITSYLFAGPGGTGKTTAAVLLCRLLGVEYEVIEGSVNNDVDYAKYVLSRKAEMGTINGKYRVIILDEADYLTPNSQAALRNVINTNLTHCRWILTANFPERLIDELKTGRTPNIDFNYSAEEIKEVAPILFKRLGEICKEENIEIEDKKSFARYVLENLPNIRYILKSIQMVAASNNGKIPEDITLKREDLTLEYFKQVINADYTELSRFINRTPQQDIMRFLEDNLVELFPDPEQQITVMTYAANFQSQSKGVESIYTKALLLNLKKMLRGN